MAKQTKADLEAEVMELRQRVEKLEAMLADSAAKKTQAAEAAGPDRPRERFPGMFCWPLPRRLRLFLGNEQQFTKSA